MALWEQITWWEKILGFVFYKLSGDHCEWIQVKKITHHIIFKNSLRHRGWNSDSVTSASGQQHLFVGALLTTVKSQFGCDDVTSAETSRGIRLVMVV